jgi:hypothetical protein
MCEEGKERKKEQQKRNYSDRESEEKRRKKSSWEHKDKNIESDMTHTLLYSLPTGATILLHSSHPLLTQVAALYAYLSSYFVPLRTLNTRIAYIFTGSLPSMHIKPRY